MKTKHNYFELENSLTYGRYFVYMSAPSRAPGAVESKETGGEKQDDKEKPATLKDVKDKLQGIKNMLRRTTERHKKTAENNPKIKQLKQKIAEIEKKIKDVEKQKGEKRQKVINEVNGELDGIIEAATGRKPGRVKVRSAKPEKKDKAPKPKEGVRESADKLGGLKKKLGKLLDSVHDNTKEFHEVRVQMDKAIGEILTEMSIDLKNVQKTQFINLPGGYRMSVQKWTVNADKMPNAIIYKGKDLMCYRDYGVLRQGDLANNDSASRTAHIVKCFDQFPKSFRVVNDSFQITNLDNFVLMGIDIAQFSRQDKPWTARLASCRISYNPADKLVTIQPRGLKYKVVFNQSDTSKISFIKEGDPKPDVWDMQEWVEKPKDQKTRLKGEAKQRVENKKVLKKKNSELKRKRETARKKKENQQLKDRMIKAEKVEVRGKVKKLLNPNFSKLVTPSKDDPKSFTVKAEKNDKKGLNLIDNTPIHKLLKLNQSKSEVIMITIKGTKGTREAMYYPGQTTAYVVNSKGKQTNNRVKFYNGDTISLDFKKPDKSDYANLNRDKRGVKLKLATKKSPSKPKSKPKKTPRKAKEGLRKKETIEEKKARWKKESETRNANEAKMGRFSERYKTRFKMLTSGRKDNLKITWSGANDRGLIVIKDKNGDTLEAIALGMKDIGESNTSIDSTIKAALRKIDSKPKKTPRKAKEGLRKKETIEEKKARWKKESETRNANEAKMGRFSERYKTRFKMLTSGRKDNLKITWSGANDRGLIVIKDKNGDTLEAIALGMKDIGESNTSIDSTIKAALRKIDSKKK